MEHVECNNIVKSEVLWPLPGKTIQSRRKFMFTAQHQLFVNICRHWLTKTKIHVFHRNVKLTGNISTYNSFHVLVHAEWPSAFRADFVECGVLSESSSLASTVRLDAVFRVHCGLARREGIEQLLHCMHESWPFRNRFERSYGWSAKIISMRMYNNTPSKTTHE